VSGLWRHQKGVRKGGKHRAMLTVVTIWSAPCWTKYKINASRKDNAAAVTESGCPLHALHRPQHQQRKLQHRKQPNRRLSRTISPPSNPFPEKQTHQLRNLKSSPPNPPPLILQQQNPHRCQQNQQNRRHDRENALLESKREIKIAIAAACDCGSKGGVRDAGRGG
jgi:hypothetical protein